MSLPRAALAVALLTAAIPPAGAAPDPAAVALAAAGDPEGDPIDFDKADADARALVYRRDVELAAGRPAAEAATVLAAELGWIFTFPAWPDPFPAGLEQTALTPAMAEALPIAAEVYRLTGELVEARRMDEMWDRVAALDDVPRWALECRWGLLGGHDDPTPCETLAAAHATAHGWSDERVTRLLTFADVIAGRRAPPVPETPAELSIDRVRGSASEAARVLDAWDRQVAAGLTGFEAAVVLDRWGEGEDRLEELGPPLAADAGAWSTAIAEAVVLRNHLGRWAPDVHRWRAPTGEHLGGTMDSALASAFATVPAWHALDPHPGEPGDVPALAARCRHARVRAVDAPETSPAPCRTLADRLEVAGGPLDPQVLDLRAAAARIAGRPVSGHPLLGHDRLGERARAALAGLHRPADDGRGSFLENEEGELGGAALSWDRELEVGTPVARVPAVLAKYRVVDAYDLGAPLAAPSPDGGAWAPAMVDGLVVAVVEAQLRGDAGMGVGGLDAWRAALSGPRGGDPLDDLPALAARCRERLMRRQLGHAPPRADDAAPCVALADELARGLDPTAPDVMAALTRALALATAPDERAALRAALDAPWVDPDAPETRRARSRLLAVGHPWATVYREAFIEYYDVDSLEVIDALRQDLAAGLTARQAAAAIARRSEAWIDWLDTMRRPLTPPFPADAGAWPQEMVESLAAMVVIGHRLGRPQMVFPLMPALERIEDAPGVDDMPALAARCAAAELDAMDGRAAPDTEPCETLLMRHEAALGPAHGRLTLERLRLAGVAESRGERVAADRWRAEALALWVDPPTVDDAPEALHTIARALRGRGHGLAALGRIEDALAALAEGRAMAAAGDYERVQDGLLFLAEEAELAATAGLRDVAAGRLRAFLDEVPRTRDRYTVGEAEDEFDGSYVDPDATTLSSVRMLLALGRAFARVDEPALVADFVAALDGPGGLVPQAVRGSGIIGLTLDLFIADAPPRTGPELAALLLANAHFGLQLDDLAEHPLAISLMAELASEQARTDPDAARSAAYRALVVQTVLDRRVRPWESAAAAAAAARGRGQVAVAIAWAKEAVDAVQQARGDIGALGLDSEQAFLQTHATLYGLLIGLLVEAGRLAEADATERRLGRIELAGLTRAGRAAAAREPVPRVRGEGLWREGIALAALGLRQVYALEPDTAETWYAEKVGTLEAALEANSVDAAPPDDGVGARLAALGPTALLQVTLTADETHLVLSTAAGRDVITRPGGRGPINRMAHDFYRALREGAPMAEVAGRSAALYAELLAPIADTLDRQGITTLMVAPSGALRYVPFAALAPQGGPFAVERWAVVRYPTLSADVFDRPPLRPGCRQPGPAAEGDCIAAFGAREAGGGLSALPFVPAELDGIVRRDADDLDGVVDGSMYLDRAFTADALQAALRARVPLIHIASHFVFRPDASAASFLALGAGARLELEQLAGDAYDFGHVELLVLSACETAVGTFAAGQPPDSFSALALHKGARSVLASLWPVADDSTATLMRTFYRHLAAGHSKAEALRRAQLALIAGPAPTGATRKFGLPGARVETGAHPYAWAPFVLMGDWR